MACANTDETRVLIFGVDVMQMDETNAGTDRRPEEMLDVAALPR